MRLASSPPSALRPLSAGVLFAASVVAGLAWAPAAAAQGPIRDGSFVRVDGTRFVVDDAPFSVVGANAAVMHGVPHRTAMTETLEAAAADGLSVIRIWALGEYAEDARVGLRDYAFRVGPEGWVEESFAHLDRVLAEARRLNLRVIVVLANRWGDYGGTTQYLRWSGSEVAERSLPSLALSAFWECAECEARYRAHVRRVVGRTSSVTGRPLAEDPTIFAWELMNEMEAAGTVGEAAMLAWIDRQAALLRELDANHLVSAGHIGYSRLADRRLWTEVCGSEHVDYCDSHAYPLRFGRAGSAAALARWVDDRVQLAHYVVGKPLLFGEVGFRTDRGPVRGATGAEWLRRFLRRVFGDGAAGALVWIYLPSGGPRRDYGVYTAGPRVRQTRPVRRVLREHAARVRRRVPTSYNRALGHERGREPLFDPTVALDGSRLVHRGWSDDAQGGRTLRIDPRQLERARFEGLGTWDGDPGPPHFYGAGTGHVSYRFRLPAGPLPARLRLRLHASSELPGAGGGASPDDTSELAVSLDDVEVGTLTAPPDDGLGHVLELEIPGEVLSRLGRRPVHRLTIAATGAGAGGVCLYQRDVHGEATGIELRLD